QSILQSGARPQLAASLLIEKSRRLRGRLLRLLASIRRRAAVPEIPDSRLPKATASNGISDNKIETKLKVPSIVRKGPVSRSRAARRVRAPAPGSIRVRPSKAKCAFVRGSTRCRFRLRRHSSANVYNAAHAFGSRTAARSSPCACVWLAARRTMIKSDKPSRTEQYDPTRMGRAKHRRRPRRLPMERNMSAYLGKYAILTLPLLITATPVHAEGVKFDAVVAQKEAIRLDFADPSKHFFLLVRREGKAEGQGPLAGANVQEFDAHDVIPGV